MRNIGLFIGPEISAEKEAFYQGPWEDPSSTLRLASLAASWAVSRKKSLLVLGDGPALLSVGTAVLGQQQGRVLEGGERRPSPIRVLSLMAGRNPELDRAMGFRRRPPGEEEPQRRPFRDIQEPEGRREPSIAFGDLSLLLDAGVMDLVGDSRNSLEPRSPGAISESLPELLFDERPEGILTFGQIPKPIARSTQIYTRETNVPFRSVLGRIEGAEGWRLDPSEPVLNGRLLRLSRERPRDQDSEEEESQEFADKEMMQAALHATWEAEMTFQLYEWLESLEGSGGGKR